MAKIGVSFNIDVKKIDKARLHVGEKGTYLNMTGFIDLDEKDQYGNSGFVSQDVSKEERESGVLGVILGNSKVFWRDQQQAPVQQQAPQQGGQQAPEFDASDEIPF